MKHEMKLYMYKGSVHHGSTIHDLNWGPVYARAATERHASLLFMKRWKKLNGYKDEYYIDLPDKIIEVREE